MTKRKDDIRGLGRKHERFAVVQFFRCGPRLISLRESKSLAMREAEQLVDDAVRDFGFGVASVYRANVTIVGPPLRLEGDSHD